MIRLCGDTHGKHSQYFDIVKDCEYSIQLGDFGFAQSWLQLDYSGLDPVKHKVISGNHDDPISYTNSPYWLGDYGSFNLDNRDMFFIRGGISIDRTYRVGEWMSDDRKSYKTWWSSEELDFNQLFDAYYIYRETKPDILLSHAAPSKIRDMIVGNNKNPNILTRFGFDLGFDENTALLLQKCLDFHMPKLHVFCHLHKHFDEVIDGCRFVCLPELQFIDI